MQPRLEATWGASTAPSLLSTASPRIAVLVLLPHGCCALRGSCDDLLHAAAASCALCLFPWDTEAVYCTIQYWTAIMHCNKLLLHRVHAFSYSDASASDSSEERSAEVSESKEIRQWRWYQSALRGRSPVPLLSG